MSLRAAINAKCKRAPKGSGTTTTHGYRRTGKRYDHRAVAEKVLGRPLRGKEEVHHWNEDKADNRNSNLVICPNRAYHMLLHRRARAYDTCGHADWIKCSYCGQYDAPENLATRKSAGSRCHTACAVEYNRRRAHGQS